MKRRRHITPGLEPLGRRLHAALLFLVFAALTPWLLGWSACPLGGRIFCSVAILLIVARLLVPIRIFHQFLGMLAITTMGLVRLATLLVRAVRQASTLLRFSPRAHPSRTSRSGITPVAIALPPVLSPIDFEGPEIHALLTLRRHELPPARPSVSRPASETDPNRLETILKDHHVAAKVIDIWASSALTTYRLQLPSTVRVSRLLSLDRDIAVGLGVPSVRVVAPSAAGDILVEVPARVRAPVSFAGLLDDLGSAAPRSSTSIPIGRDVRGEPVVVDLATLVHVLVAGTTGSGKTSLLRSILLALVTRLGPHELRVVLVDPKDGPDFQDLRGLPHLACDPIRDPACACSALEQVLHRIDDRFRMMASPARSRPATTHSRSPWPGNTSAAFTGSLPWILVVVDELASLLELGPPEIEARLTRIASIGRAARVVLLLATQRPSADVLTGLLKTNLPSRIALRVPALTDSRIILDQPGAEKLLGAGDALVTHPGLAAPLRIQGPMVQADEVRRIRAYYHDALIP